MRNSRQPHQSGLLSGEAFAKINRELRVGCRRPDGFHEIRSRFCTIDFSDRIAVDEAEGFELVASGIPVPGAVDSNLVAKAAKALARRLGIAPEVRVRLEKRIPPGTGLGGGSSDAAATLLLLSRLWRSALSQDELVDIAASIGSDVPFFLFGGEADVEGRGERVTPRGDPPALELTLLIPPFSVSTAEVYTAYARESSGAARLPDRLEIESSGTFLGPNDLAPFVLAKPPMEDYLATARRVSRECGITGSGSTLVLLEVDSTGIAELERRHPGAMIRRVRTLGRDAYRQRTAV
jgi:4-diphosphocytidyl-2-C-methyl-D-erythritol kinase